MLLDDVQKFSNFFTYPLPEKCVYNAYNLGGSRGATSQFLSKFEASRQNE